MIVRKFVCNFCVLALCASAMQSSVLAKETVVGPEKGTLIIAGGGGTAA